MLFQESEVPSHNVGRET